jgi:Tol biopolymer transport system component
MEARPQRKKGRKVNKRYALAAIALGGLIVSTIVPADSSWAGYPGHNGRLAFGVQTDPSNPNSADIYTVRPDGHDRRRLTGLPTQDLCAAYSPDGRWIAYCSGVTGPGQGVLEIWVMRANGKEQHQVTQTGGVMTFPDFSPDGSKIVFSGRLPGAATPDVFAINTDGTGMVRLTTDPGVDRYAAYSPDGSKVAFNSNRSGIEQVWLMNADGTDQRQLTIDPATKGQLPDWSPDGTRIAYESLATSGGDIYVMDADGSDPMRLNADAAEDFAPAWSPDETKIAFASRRGGGITVYVMNADGSGQHAISPGGIQFAPSWQPLIDDDAKHG